MDRTHWTLDDYCDFIGATVRPTSQCPIMVVRVELRHDADGLAECWQDFVVPHPFPVALDSPCNTEFYDVNEGSWGSDPIVTSFKSLRDALDETIGDGAV